MLAKIGIVIAGTALAVCFMGRVDSVARHRGFNESVARAQDSDDQGDGDAISPDDSTPQDDAAAQSNPSAVCKVGGPASGIYSGTVMDNNMGAGTIGASLFQCHSKLGGTWQDTFVPPAFWKGTIKSGHISARMRFHLTGKCGYLFKGVFEHGNEISGNYTLNGCKGMAADHGTFDMFKQ